MYKRYKDGTIVKFDETKEGLNTLRCLGNSLPFTEFTVFLKFEGKSYFDKDRFFQLHKDFTKTEVSEALVKTLAKNQQILLIRKSQFKHLIDLAITNNIEVARLRKETGELLEKISFLTKEENNKISYV